MSARLTEGGAFPGSFERRVVSWAGRLSDLRLLALHPRDPRALVLTAPLRPVGPGAWAGKIATHSAHHRFGTRGYMPHLQVNVWRVGVKGSGAAYRIALAPAVLAGVYAVRAVLVAAVTAAV